MLYYLNHQVISIFQDWAYKFPTVEEYRRYGKNSLGVTMEEPVSPMIPGTFFYGAGINLELGEEQLAHSYLRQITKTYPDNRCCPDGGAYSLDPTIPSLYK